MSLKNEEKPCIDQSRFVMPMFIQFSDLLLSSTRSTLPELNLAYIKLPKVFITMNNNQTYLSSGLF